MAYPLPKSAGGLPPRPLTPAGICEFVRNCFTPALCDVDFTQAVRAIEYLSVLNERMKREICAALRRLNIDETNIAPHKENLRHTSPQAFDRVCSIEDKARKAEALYTQAYIGLRRWALINEMRLMPFSKTSCFEVLDELYPPTYSKLPTPQLTHLILESQREAFCKYIKSVEKFGRSVLKNLENQSKRPTDANGWPVVRDILERYLRNTSRVIDICIATRGLDTFEPHLTKTPASRSPSSDRSRPALNHSVTYPGPWHARRPSAPTSQVTPQLQKEQQEWLQQQPQQQQIPAHPLKKSSSTFGRLANEFRRIKSKNADSRTDQHVRSQSALDFRPTPRARPAFTPTSREPSREGRKHSRSNSTEPTVQIDDAYRERLIQEAKRSRDNKTHKRQHSPVNAKLEERRFEPTPKPLPETEVHPSLRTQPELLEEDRYFFITDAATWSTPISDKANARPFKDSRIAELAA